jgi:hypothetical protein
MISHQTERSTLDLITLLSVIAVIILQAIIPPATPVYVTCFFILALISLRTLMRIDITLEEIRDKMSRQSPEEQTREQKTEPNEAK